MKTYNGLQKLETPLLKRILNAYSADYGRVLTSDERIDREKAIAMIQVEILSRKKTDLDVAPLRFMS
jgi:hypothetical protein